jgi:hypothetical protein
MSEDSGGGTDEPRAAMVYADSFVPARWDGKKCLIVCHNPRYQHGLRGPRCPWCGGRTHLHEEGTDILIRAQQAGERFAAALWGMLSSPFRRQEVAEESGYCDECPDYLGPVCDDRGCVFETFQATKEAVSEAGK